MLSITNNETNTNPSEISNAFNNYFAKITNDIQSPVKFFEEKIF